MKKAVKSKVKNPKKTITKKSKRRQQQKRTTIKGQPIHLDTPRGKFYNTPISYGYILKTSKRRELTLPQINAVRKSIYYKNVRKLLHVRTRPYLDKTKKPSEVRMGKGRGIKINKQFRHFCQDKLCLKQDNIVLLVEMQQL